MGFYNQMTAVQLAKPQGPLCGDIYKLMKKKCTLDKGHEGSHCEEKQCGDAVVRFYWDRKD